jgi:hypothetical protein
MKKVLSLVLVIAMILSSFSFAFAAKFEDVEGDYEEAIDTLVALGVISGYEDGTFRPENIVTRAEMAKLIVEILGYGDLVSGAKSNFADTQGHWADAWIALASGKGLVLGDGDGNFRPNDPVSYDEAITMIVRALGYTDDCNELKGMTWPTNFKVKASELDLLDGVKSLAGGADRGGVAQLLFNALDATLVTVTTDGDVTAIFDTIYVDGDSVRENRILLSRLADKKTYKVEIDHIDPDDKDYKGDVVDLTPYMYQEITVYEKDDVVVFVKSVDSLLLKGTVDEQTAEVFKVEDAKEDIYTFALTGADKNIDDDTPVLLNGEEVDFEDAADLEDALEGAEVTVVLDDEDGEKIAKDVKQKVIGIVARLATDTVQITEEYVEDELELEADPDNVILPVDDDEVDFDRLVVTGEVDSLEDIEVDDVVALYYGKGVANEDNKLEIHVTRKTVEGKVTRKNNDNHVTVGGNVYKPFDGSTEDLSVGDEVVLFLTQDGKVFSFEHLDAKVNEDYAVVLDVTNGFQTPGGTRITEPKIKLLTAAGEKITYVIDDSGDVDNVNLNVATDEIVVSYNKGDLVEYNLDDGEIDELKLAVNQVRKPGLKTSGNSFNVASNAPIFNLPKEDLPESLPNTADDDVENAKVVDVDDLKDSVDAVVVYDGAKIVAMVVYGRVGEVDDVYALIVSNDATALDEDDDEVVEYVAFVDGKKVTYLGDSKTVVGAATPSGILVELTLEGGKLTGASEITVPTSEINIVSGKAKDKRVGNYIEPTVGANVFLANDVVVYVVEADGDVVLGSKSDIRNNNFTAYNLNFEDTDDFGIVVVFE